MNKLRNLLLQVRINSQSKKMRDNDSDTDRLNSSLKPAQKITRVLG